MDEVDKVLRDNGYETLFRGHPDAIYAMTIDGRFIDCNESLLLFTGYTREELTRSYFGPLVEAKSRGVARENFTAATLGHAVRFDMRGQKKNGDVFFVDVTHIPLRNSDGVVVGVLGMARDITELREARLQIDASQMISKSAGRIARFAGWKIDVENQELLWSDELFAILGIDAHSTPRFGDMLETFYDEPHRTVVRRAVYACMDFGTPFDVRAKVRDVRGRELDVRILGEAVRDKFGAVVRVEGAFHDISALVRQQHELASLEHRVAETLNQVDVALFFIGRDWHITFVNQAGLALTGMSEDELRAGSIWELFPDALTSQFNDLYRAAMDHRQFGVATAFIQRFGRYFEEIVHPFADGIVLSIRDATAEQESQKKVDEYTQRVAFLAQMLDLAKDPMLIEHWELGITYWNRAAEELYGWTFAEVEHASALELLYADPAPAKDAFAAVRRDGFWSGVLRQRARGGRVIVVDCRWQLIYDAAGKPLGVFGVNIDVTTSMREQELLLRAQRMESIGTLAGGLAHDLNNVFTPILMSLDLLARDELDERKRELLASMEKSVHRGSDMIRRVLSFARGVDGDRQTVPLPRLLEGVLQFCHDTLPKNINLTFDFAEARCAVRGDETQLMQVLINLITNARDAMPDGGQLTVRSFLREDADANGPRVVIGVSDTGTGMESAVQSRMFEPFFTTKKFGEGTGLGLSTSLAIIESHGGTVDVESVVRRGTNITIVLPAQVPLEPGLVVGPTLSSSTRNVVARRILVVDDEDAILAMMGQVLRNEGFSVEVAPNGTAALETLALADQPFDLIISDLNMPHLGGEQFATLVNERGVTTSFIFMSGLDASSTLSANFGGSAVRFLQKPFTKTVLMKMVETIFN